MKKTRIVLAMALLSSLCFAQGITRQSGFGIQVNYWNMSGENSSLLIDNSMKNNSVSVNGMGATLRYFNRFYGPAFLEVSTGAIGNVSASQSDYVHTDVTVNSIIPFLIGIRYDLLGSRISGAIHPYIIGGFGSYWLFDVHKTNELTGSTTSFESRMDTGWYAGGGVHFVIASFLALNADIKYHKADLLDDRDLSGVQLGLGLNVMWGRKREIYEIVGTRVVVKDIYPAYHQFYNTYPLALVAVKNLVGYPIEVSITGEIPGISGQPKEGETITIERGQTKDVPVTVYFNKDLLTIQHNQTVILDMNVHVRASKNFKCSLTSQLVIHNRNSWNGEIDKLHLYLNPENEDIRSFTRSIVLTVDEQPGIYIRRAEAIFNALAAEQGIQYLPDPNIPFYQDDRVQFATETLDKGSGDCDDLTVLYATMLESVGIQTAFVQVRDPEKEIAHLYLLFNTGATVENSHWVSSNEKRFILRENAAGKNMVWVPVETTMLHQDFESAWTFAATAWLKDAHLRNGLADEWVKIYDFH